MKYNPVQCVELFHLLFLDQLGRKLDKRLYALKGGCNLRFYLKSVRYSQDIDLDVKTVRVETLQKTVRTILQSPALKMMLQAHSLEIIHFSEAKQTDTTQRWKVQLKGSSGLILPTKIEFSRRQLEEPIDFESIDTQISSAYHLYPIFAPHYGPAIAFRQKVHALAARTETQARDIWDLFHLINAYQVKEADGQFITKACENAGNIGFADFKDQVLAFFPEEMQAMYNHDSWNKVQLDVIEYLEALR